MGSKTESLTPEGLRAKEAALALYRAVRLPEPNVAVVTDTGRFTVASRCMTHGTSIFDLAVPSILLILGLLHVVGVFPGGKSPIEEFVCVAIALAAAGLLAGKAADVARSPFWIPASPPDVLIDALVSAGVMTTPSADVRSPLIVLRLSRPGPPAEARDEGSVNHVACLAAELRLAAAGAILGREHVLLLATGSETVATPPQPPPGLLDRYLGARRIRRVHKLEPAAAQSLIEEKGPAKCMAILGAEPFATDEAGALWDVPVRRGRLRWLQVADPATGADAWLSVPNHVVSPREAVAWTYGMGPAAYAPTLEG